MMDVYDMWRAHDIEQERRLARRPVCSHCGEHIQEEELFDIDGKLYHEECAIELFRKWAEDYET